MKVGPSLNAYNDIPNLYGTSQRTPDIEALPVECLLVIDSGFSHTTVTPLYNGRPIHQAIRRLEVGGKLLTNYLKELVSIRHFNLVDETYLTNEIKEAVCYVSGDFRDDLERTWKRSNKYLKKRNEGDPDVLIDYVLPDYKANGHGSIRPHDPSLAARLKKMGAVGGPDAPTEDFMTLGNERFTVPELLFNPSNIGMKEAGIPQTVFQSLSGIPPGLWPAMLANIIVVGGNSNLKGFMERL